MKLLAISTQVLPTPPVGADGKATYGGLEQVVWNHCKGLADLGEDVTMIGCKGSKAPKGVKLLELEEPGNFAGEERAFHFYKAFLHEYDVILDHSWYKWAMLAGDYLPIMGTMHSPVPFATAPPRKFPMLCGVSAQHSVYACQKLGVPVRTTWNSVDLSQYPFTKERGDYFLSVNRIDPNKGIHIFADWIGRADLKGEIIGDDKLIVKDKAYPITVQEQCKRYGINYRGLVTHEEKVASIQGCKAVVLLPQASAGYLEVFGLAAVEALACGKPVICTPNCGLKDIVTSSETGFFVESYEQFEAASKLVDTLSPEACRKAAERFSIENITPKYRDMIKKVREGSRW